MLSTQQQTVAENRYVLPNAAELVVQVGILLPVGMLGLLSHPVASATSSCCDLPNYFLMYNRSELQDIFCSWNSHRIALAQCKSLKSQTLSNTVPVIGNATGKGNFCVCDVNTGGGGSYSIFIRCVYVEKLPPHTIGKRRSCHTGRDAWILMSFLCVGLQLSHWGRVGNFSHRHTQTY